MRKWSSPKGESYGSFNIPHPTEPDVRLRCIVGDVEWDHVSVSVGRADQQQSLNRTPTWEEMAHIKDLFFSDDEVVMQLHPAKKDYVNIHPFVLHLWRPQNAAIPLPPLEFV